MSHSDERRELNLFIREKLRKSGISINELANRLDIRASSASSLLQGDNDMRVSSILKLEEVLGIKIIHY